jgi:putative GTP pyrophosphokinase
VSFEPSRTAIDKAGIVLRDWWLGSDAEIDYEVAEAFQLVWNFRRTFRSPLQKVTVGIRQFVQRESSAVIVGQRLKRVTTIIDKLARLENMKVTRMEDIGGCRAILPGGRAEIEGVLGRMAKNRWEVRRLRDYIAEPKDTGYRAVHVVVQRDERPIEIQLRTPAQHMWAANVERAGAMLGFELKDGVGPEDLVRFFQLLGDALAFRDAGIEPDEDHRTEFVALFKEVRDRYPHVFAVT